MVNWMPLPFSTGVKFRLLVCCSSILALLFPIASNAEEAYGGWREQVVAAYLASTDVLCESERLQAEGFVPGEVEMVNLGGYCGVAGCDFTYLVVQTFSQPRVNPQTSNVLALVTVRQGPGGEIGPVRLAEIVPREPERGPPHLRVEGKTPPPELQLRIDRRIPCFPLNATKEHELESENPLQIDR